MTTVAADTGRRVALLILTSLSIVFVLSPFTGGFLKLDDIRAGQTAAYTVRAPRDIIAEDVVATERRRIEAERAVKRVFVFDDLRSEALRGEVALTLSRAEAIAVDGTISKEESEAFEREFRLNFDEAEWRLLLDRSNWPDIEVAVQRVLQPILESPITASRTALQSALGKSGAVFLRKSTFGEQDVLPETKVYDLKEALDVLEASFESLGSGPVFDSLVKKFAVNLLRPNITFDSRETGERELSARARIPPILEHVRRGDLIVRVGETISAAQEARFRRYADLQKNFLSGMLSYFILTLLILASLYEFAATFWPNFRPKIIDLIAISLTLIFSFILVRLSDVLGEVMNFSYPEIDSSVFLAGAPVATGGVLLQIILGAPSVVLFTLSFAFLTTVFLDGAWNLVMLIAIGNIVGAMAAKRCSKRSTFISASLRIAFVNALVMLCGAVLSANFDGAITGASLLCGISGGLISGVLAGSLTPIAEYFGGYITDFKLLELASLERPLLRDLSLQAPGTWNHSMVMGQLGEVAAEAIGANPLLTRVSAYYHDIGKTKKPAYFVENQTTRENKHDKLAPSMSALIIRAHVKDGIEMAKQHRLPRAIIDAIPQHHGTALIEYFYDKAAKEAGEGELVDESHYRYPGPKPQTKEAGILMLADHVEAASRTLADPAPARIQGMVQKMINKVFTSGQLDECELTFRDLHLIAKSFIRVLTGILHRRVEYSEPAEKVREAKESKDVPTEELSAPETNGRGKGGAAASDRPDKPDTKEALKRLGI